MAKMSIADAALHFGVSKEAIHNRVRRGSLECFMQDGIKMVVVDETAPQRAQQRASSSQHTDERYYKLLEEQNAKLQERVDLLEGETRTLREQKEQMLIAERQKIEEIYQQKDEQLKNILNAISSKFMLGAPDETIEQHVEAEIEVESVDDTPDEQISGVISLKKYLKSKNYSKKRTKKLTSKFLKYAKKDTRIIVIGKKLYLDIRKYDYSDLL